jgi:hypothetical protein
METGSVKIFTNEKSPRLSYIADLLLNEILGLKWENVTDRRKLGKHPVINYSDQNIPGSFRIFPSGLLYETGLRQLEIKVSKWKDLPVFFTSEERADFPFDIFSASFYLVSRYEEYLIIDHDKYGRFKTSDSLAFKNGFLKVPVVEMWTKALANALVRKYQYMTFKRSEYSALTTVDADESFKYIGRGVKGTFTGLLSDLSSGKRKASAGMDNLSKGSGDPYDVFGYILDTLKSSQSPAGFFIPVGTHSKFDQNPSWKNEKYRELIKSISTRFSIGLHASFKAGTDLQTLRKESDHIMAILGSKPTLNRFHYLRISFPDSYRKLLKADIMEDYSMGFSDEPGFRAGISRPFRFYDIPGERSTELQIKPFQFMDAMFFNDERNDPEAALLALTAVIDQTRKAGGTFVSVWHNTTLLETTEGKVWRNVFEKMLKSQVP